MARHRPLRLATLAMLFQVLTVSVASSCFFPNGTLQTDPVYQPCTNIAGAFSMCCATNRTKNQDTCLANGLCQNVVQNSGNTGFVPSFYRDTCTDKTWQSPQCLAICDTGSGGSNSRHIARHGHRIARQSVTDTQNQVLSMAVALRPLAMTPTR